MKDNYYFVTINIKFSILEPFFVSIIYDFHDKKS